MTTTSQAARSLGSRRAGRPPLRRDRLTGWLDERRDRRLIVIAGGPGYGKTTLVEQYGLTSGRIVHRCRLDTRHRDPDLLAMEILRVLGRGLAPRDPTGGTITGTAGAILGSRDTSDTTSVTGVGDLTASDEDRATGARGADARERCRDLVASGAVHGLLVLDDYQAVDDEPAVAEFVRDLVDLAEDGLTLVLVGRRRPNVPVARWRAVGEVAELGPDALGFDLDETARFLGVGSGPDAAVVARTVLERTGGWPLAVGMIETRVAEPTLDGVVAAMSAADPDLDAYLAEDVIAGLPADLRRIALLASLIDRIDPRLLAAATGIDRARAEAAIEALAGAGLIVPAVSPGGSETSGSDGRILGEEYRFLPIVAARLRAWLEREEDPGSRAATHRAIAAATIPDEWEIAAGHLARAGDPDAIRTLVAVSLDRIIDRGEFERALRLVGGEAALRDPVAIILGHTHLQLRRGDYPAAVEQARELLRQVESGTRSHRTLALDTIVTVGVVADDADLILAARALGAATPLQVPVTTPNPTDALDGFASELIDAPQRPSRRRGFLLARSAAARLAIGDAVGAIADGTDAVANLAATASPREHALALVTLGAALAEDGAWGDALDRWEAAVAVAPMDAAVLAAAAEAHAWHGDPASAVRLDAAAHDLVVSAPAIVEGAELDARVEATPATVAILGERADPSTRPEIGGPPAPRAIPIVRVAFDPGLLVRSACRDAVEAHLVGDPRAAELARLALGVARRAGSPTWTAVAQLLVAFPAAIVPPPAARTPRDRSRESRSHPATETPLPIAPVTERLLADIRVLERVGHLVVGRLPGLPSSVGERIVAAAPTRPRWRAVLLLGTRQGSAGARVAAARLLARVGERADVEPIAGMLRALKVRGEDADLARRLARRTAPRIFVDDLGRVGLVIGGAGRGGPAIRRKVLALVCYLLTRRDLAAGREEVLDALWPDLDPETAGNSLNQTLYFLRRTFEAPYAEERSPGYVHHDSDVIWFDRELVTSRSLACRELIDRARSGRDRAAVDELSALYTGRFALDFAYEQWAESHRESLHAGYLAAVEGALALAIEAGEIERGLALARRALDLDPAAEQIELALLRLYRLAGAHAAAAEQYGHYAAVLRDELGVEPPPLDQL